MIPQNVGVVVSIVNVTAPLFPARSCTINSYIHSLVMAVPLVYGVPFNVAHE